MMAKQIAASNYICKVFREQKLKRSKKDKNINVQNE